MALGTSIAQKLVRHSTPHVCYQSSLLPFCVMVLEKSSGKIYTFKNNYKDQLHFNDRVDDRIDATKSHLERIVITDHASKLAMQKA